MTVMTVAFGRYASRRSPTRQLLQPLANRHLTLEQLQERLCDAFVPPPWTVDLGSETAHILPHRSGEPATTITRRNGSLADCHSLGPQAVDERDKEARVKLGMNMLLWATDVSARSTSRCSRCCATPATTASRCRSSTRRRSRSRGTSNSAEALRPRSRTTRCRRPDRRRQPDQRECRRPRARSPGDECRRRHLRGAWREDDLRPAGCSARLFQRNRPDPRGVEAIGREPARGRRARRRRAT